MMARAPSGAILDGVNRQTRVIFGWTVNTSNLCRYLMVTIKSQRELVFHAVQSAGGAVQGAVCREDQVTMFTARGQR